MFLCDYKISIKYHKYHLRLILMNNKSQLYHNIAMVMICTNKVSFFSLHYFDLKNWVLI